MIQYNPKDWFSLIFKFHKSDTFRVLLPILFFVALYSGMVAYVEIEIFHQQHNSTTVLHSLLGFVISLLLVFRTNTAYERWWEGRKLWGQLVNNSRNLAAKLNHMLPTDGSVDRNFINAWMSFFPHCLKHHLRNDKIGENDERVLLLPKKVIQANHVPNAMVQCLFEQLNNWRKLNIVNDSQILFLMQELNGYADVCGACERIKKTPIPFSYSLFLKKFIFLYIMTMPFTFVSDFQYWIIVVVPLLFYVLASLELIAEEIEDPFGKDANDLPLDEISKVITRDVSSLFTTVKPID